ncbi:MAG TPA: molybdenum cofactor biosynthesis protein B [Longimicrobiaceae bacterium]|nr:molybdenum cofactor biosynthesis protein B [Longimicrobiaceae bacterium]
MPSASSQQHRQAAAGRGPVRVALITVSDSRTVDTDVNAAYLRDAVAAAGDVVASYALIRDEPELVAEALDAATGVAQVAIFNGGTGIGRRDTTYDAISARLEKTLPGFGELFRMLSWEQVGSAAMLSRATAGVYRGCVVFSVPGSPAAVRLAWERLIAPELQHVAWELVR